jgi:hypothetical protein
MRRKRTKAELDRIRRRAEEHPRVRLLRELEARGWAELEARGLTPDQRKLRDLYLETKASS